MQLRCPSRIQAELTGDFSSLPLGTTAEILCPAKHCGAGGGVLVLHKYELSTGELIETHQFKNPNFSNRRY